MQELEQRPAKKRRFFVEDSDVNDYKEKHASPGAVMSAGDNATTDMASSVATPSAYNGANVLNGHGNEETGGGDGQETLDPHAFGAVVGEDVTGDVIERIREMCGDNLTRG